MGNYEAFTNQREGPAGSKGGCAAPRQVLKNIALYQKEIKIAVRSNLGWQVVAAYESDKLASNLDDQKQTHVFRAKKEVEKRRKQSRQPPQGLGSEWHLQKLPR